MTVFIDTVLPGHIAASTIDWPSISMTGKGAVTARALHFSSK
jgi:hypothetical protein